MSVLLFLTWEVETLRWSIWQLIMTKPCGLYLKNTHFRRWYSIFQPLSSKIAKFLDDEQDVLGNVFGHDSGLIVIIPPNNCNINYKQEAQLIGKKLGISI